MSDQQKPEQEWRLVPMLVALPVNARGAQVRAVASWTNDVGIQTPAKEVSVQTMTPDQALILFVSLITEGVVGVLPHAAAEQPGSQEPKRIIPFG